MMKFAAAIAAALLASATVASAATISFNVDTNWTPDVRTFTNGTDSVDVEAFRYASRSNTVPTGNPFLASWSTENGGLGICASLKRNSTDGNNSRRCNESHQVDGDGNEMAVLSFGTRNVRLTAVTFARAYWGSNDRFDLFAFANGTGVAPTTTFLDRNVTSCGTNTCTADISALNLSGSIFGLGASLNDKKNVADFKIRAISFEDVPPPSVVPLPPAGWGLVAGLGALAALKRRRKAA